MLQLHTGKRSFSTHIERKKSKVDYTFNRDLNAEEIKIVEQKVNAVIDNNLNVTEKYMPIEEAKKLFNLDRLPEDAGNEIRIIEIGNFDSCPCIGQHVSNFHSFSLWDL
jgi:Ser-tRNA(Ala) deacylase AlaX